MNKKLLSLSLLLLISWSFTRAQGLIGCSANASTVPSQYYSLYESCGNYQLDLFLSTEIRVLRNFFIVQPSFYFYDDSDGANAFATPVCQLPGYNSGTVCFGLNMMLKEYQFSRSGTTLATVIAHEFGHILDYKYNAVPTSGIRKELFADFQAGCFLFYRNNFVYTEIQAALIDFYNMGDYADFNDPRHHGTPQQRLDAVVAGYNWLQQKTIEGGYIDPYLAVLAAQEYVGV